MRQSIQFSLSVFGLGLMVTACGGEPTTAPPAASTAAAPMPAEPGIDALLATADPEKGRVLFLQCRACHSLEPGGMNKVGPNLHGVFGRKIGQAPGFSYSAAAQASTIVWDVQSIDKWILRPSDVLPGTTMVFVGVPKATDRANLIAYLKRETGTAATPAQ